MASLGISPIVTSMISPWYEGRMWPMATGHYSRQLQSGGLRGICTAIKMTKKPKAVDSKLEHGLCLY